MEKKKTVCAFKGEKPSRLSFGFDEEHPDCISLKQVLKGEIIKLIDRGYDEFISGMSLGFDMWAAETVLLLKDLYPHIHLECAIPCETQANKWNAADRERYFNILASCDKTKYISYQYTENCFYQRNKYMADRCDTLMALQNDQKGSSWKMIEYVRNKDKPTILINPVTFRATPAIRELTYQPAKEA